MILIVLPNIFATPIPIITIPLATAIQGRNFATPIPSEEIAIPVNPKVTIKDAVTRRPINPPLVSLLTKIKRELLRVVMISCVLLSTKYET